MGTAVACQANSSHRTDRVPALWHAVQDAGILQDPLAEAHRFAALQVRPVRQTILHQCQSQETSLDALRSEAVQMQPVSGLIQIEGLLDRGAHEEGASAGIVLQIECMWGKFQLED